MPNEVSTSLTELLKQEFARGYHEGFEAGRELAEQFHRWQQEQARLYPAHVLPIPTPAQQSRKL